MSKLGDQHDNTDSTAVVVYITGSGAIFQPSVSCNSWRDRDFSRSAQTRHSPEKTASLADCKELHDQRQAKTLDNETS